jgi:PilZ domain-containing protein
MKSLKGLFKQMFDRDRRRADRHSSPKLSAFYWTGAAPEQHLIRDISKTGLYLLTEERWYPGTLVMMTLQKNDEMEGASERSIAVQSKAVRWGTDGVGLQFIVVESNDRSRGQNGEREGVDRRTLEKFLQGFTSDNGRAVVDRVEPPPPPADLSATKS